jgi:O-antigen ligase
MLDWATWAALFFLALQACGDRTIRHRFLQILLYFGFGLSVLSVLQMFTSGGKIFWLFPSGYPDFVLGPFVNRNQYAAFIELILPLALYRAVRGSHAPFYYWVMAAIMVGTVVAGASRAGTVLILLEVIAVPLAAMLRRSVPRRTVAFGWGQFVLLAMICTAIVGWNVLWDRFQQADPYIARREMMLSSVEMVRQHPWTGFGLGTWPTAYPAFAIFDNGLFANQAHNDWAQWAAEGGLPLFLLMVAFAVLLVRPALRYLWGIGLISVLVHCAVDYPMQQRPALAGWFFAMAGALVAVRRTSSASSHHGGDHDQMGSLS